MNLSASGNLNNLYHSLVRNHAKDFFKIFFTNVGSVVPRTAEFATLLRFRWRNTTVATGGQFIAMRAPYERAHQCRVPARKLSRKTVQPVWQTLVVVTSLNSLSRAFCTMSCAGMSNGMLGVNKRTTNRGTSSFPDKIIQGGPELTTLASMTRQHDDKL